MFRGGESPPIKSLKFSWKYGFFFRGCAMLSDGDVRIVETVCFWLINDGNWYDDGPGPA